MKNEFKLNQPGAAGWLTEDHLWLVSKTTTDKLRAHLLAQAVDGIPTSNIALFDELQSHGLVEATPESKAVWNATVTDGDWQHRFTFLRLQPSLIWADEHRPEYFSGTVEPIMDPPLTGETRKSALAGPQIAAVEQQTAAVTLSQEFDYVVDLMDMLQEPAELQARPTAKSLRSSTSPGLDDAGLAFIEWLRDGIRSHRLVVNDSKAKVHTVDGTFFLVTPGIFQRYVAEHPDLAEASPNSDSWRLLQRQFEKLDVHLKKPNGQNIWTCKVKGPRKTSSLNGYLLCSKAAISQESPADNPFLTLAR